jgi:nucleoid-associated protein YgaU
MVKRRADRKNKTSTHVKTSTWFKFLSFQESYSSLILGVIVVIVTSVILIFLIKNKNIIQQKRIAQGVTSTSIAPSETLKTQTLTLNLNGKVRIHTVANGESLWTIAEIYYKSGYNWVDIAAANKLANPGLIDTGMKLTIPNVAAKLATVNISLQTEYVYGPKISSDTYIVREGDHLWGIAVRAYSDGYKWVEIAKANNITNPDIIRPGMVLKLR